MDDTPTFSSVETGQSSVESAHDREADRLDKPRESQPEGGMRITSQTGRHHYETLGRLPSHPMVLYKSAYQVGNRLRRL